VKDVEAVGEHGTSMREEKIFSWVRLQEINTLEDVGVDARLI
jgi:hypothetical protein